LTKPDFDSLLSAERSLRTLTNSLLRFNLGQHFGRPGTGMVAAFQRPHPLLDDVWLNVRDCHCRSGYRIRNGDPWGLSEQNLRHHSFVFVLEQMTVKQRQSPDNRICEVHD
jgi:hypothetical protein